MEKKKSICILGLGVVVVGGLALAFGKAKTLELSKDFSSSNSLLAMYIEGDDGEYFLSTDNKFPTDGYALNLEKSSCTNDGVLSQDAETKKIKLKAANIDTCTLYFMKDAGKPVITAVDFKVNSSTQTVFFNSVSLEKEVLIKEYYLSVNGGEYKAISLKGTVPYNFCPDYSLTANNANFSLYVVSESGVRSDDYEFVYGEFECSANVSKSASASRSVWSSASLSELGTEDDIESPTDPVLPDPGAELPGGAEEIPA